MKKMFFLLLIILFCYNLNAIAKMKRVYKFRVIDHRGNKWVEYSTIDPMLYVRVNGGFNIIRQVLILDYWHIKVNSSLYCQNIENIKHWQPKDYTIRDVFGDDATEKKITPPDIEEKIPRFSDASDNQRKNRKEELASQNSDSLPSKYSKYLATREYKAIIPFQTKQEEIVQSENLVDNKKSKDRIHQKLQKMIQKKELTKISYLNQTVINKIRNYDSLITKAAKENNLEQNLLRALVYVESGGNRLAISHKKAMGLTQLTYPTAKEMNVRNVFDPEQNLMGGAKYLSIQIKAFGNQRDALAAYNAGPDRVNSKNLPAETKNYIDRVLYIKDIFDNGVH